MGDRTDRSGEDLKQNMNATAEIPSNLNLVLDVPVSLTIELGSCQLPMKEVLQLNIGSVVQLDKSADAPVELSVNGKLIARGEVVVIEDRFGVKITEVIGNSVAA
jgi:flagellar motor switch protein FliN/FliY